MSVLRGSHLAEVYRIRIRTRIRQDSAHFEQTGSDPDYGFIQVSGSRSRFSNFIFGICRQHNHKKNFCKDLEDVM